MCIEQWNENTQFGPKCYLLTTKIRQKCDNFPDFTEDEERKYPIFFLVFLILFWIN